MPTAIRWLSGRTTAGAGSPLAGAGGRAIEDAGARAALAVEIRARIYLLPNGSLRLMSVIEANIGGAGKRTLPSILWKFEGAPPTMTVRRE
jgi:hypothetical protein